MNQTGLKCSALLMCLAWLLSTCFAAEQAYLTPEDAGPDYRIQGEYLGQLNIDGDRQQWGGQIVALGDGQFDLIGYEGGLPGKGWRRGDTQETAHGLTANGLTRFEADEWTAVVQKGVVTVKSSDGELMGTLRKVSRQSPTLGAEPPADAVILFDGSTTDEFVDGHLLMDKWLAGECTSKRTFLDHSGHLEFRTPFKPKARGQARGNSGMYVQSRYEVQILDSFGLEGRDNECGGIYKVQQPAVNMCYPPLTWQTYDYEFVAARYDEHGNRTSNARLTVRHNGVVIHKNLELPKHTPGRASESPDPAGLFLQGHGNPVAFRNIWIVEKP